MPHEVNSVNVCDGTWEKIDITVDSGAVDTVAPPSVASHVPIESTWASREGYCYRAANGQLLPNLGERKIRGVTQEGSAVGLTFQVAEVTKVLGSVSKFCEAGNRVVFDDSDPEGGCIMNKSTGVRTQMHKSDGVYKIPAWMRKSTPVPLHRQVASSAISLVV